MHDIKAIRENPTAFDVAMSSRGLSGLSAQVLARLTAAMQVLGQDQTLASDLAQKGVYLRVSSPDEVNQFMRRDGEKWGRLIRDLGIKE